MVKAEHMVPRAAEQEGFKTKGSHGCPGKHATCGWPCQQTDITRSVCTKPLPLPGAHSAFPHFAFPIPISQSISAECGLGILKSQDSHLGLPPSRTPMHLQYLGPSSPVLFGKTLPRPFCSSFCHQAGTSGTHVTTCPPSSWKNLLLRIGSSYGAAAGMG